MNTLWNAQIVFRAGTSIFTQVKKQDLGTIGERMVSGGFLVCEDNRWPGQTRQLVINLLDVSCVIIKEAA